MPYVRFEVPFLGPESRLKSGFACTGLLCSRFLCFLLNKQNVDMVFVLCLGPPTRLILRFCGPIFGTARRSQKWDREHAFLLFLY